jgi:opacity protein-like surface antigen
MGIKEFALGCVLAFGIIAPAAAADLRLPPPPVVAPEPYAEFGGWYLRGDAGASIYSSGNWQHGAISNTPTASFVETTIGNAGFVGAGVGYQFNNWLRADITGEYRWGVKIGARASYTAFCPVAVCDDIYDGGLVSSGVFLANGYVDLGTWSGFTPYVGVGLGTAYVKSTKSYDFGPQTLAVGWINGGASWNFAWAVMAGVGYAVAPNLKLELGYRYLNMGDAKLGANVCPGGGQCGYDGSVKNIASQDIKVGLRWLLAEPVPAYEPPPLVRKY